MVQALELLEPPEPHVLEALRARVDEIISEPAKRHQMQALLLSKGSGAPSAPSNQRFKWRFVAVVGSFRCDDSVTALSSRL